MEHHVMAKLRDEPFFASSLHLDDADLKSTHGPPPNSNCPNSQEHIDSNYYESIVICNEIDVEHELKKVKDEDESVFKMLSMSFYDKSQLNRPSKTHNPSPARFEELNISIIAKQNGSSSRGAKIRAKQPSQPSISQYKDTPSANISKSKHIDPKKTKPKTPMAAKLFAGSSEKTEINTLLSQINHQKHNLTSNIKPSGGTNQSIKTLKDLAKNNTITSNYIKTNKATSPRREDLAKGTASSDKLKNIDSSIILRSHSPYIPSSNMLYTTNTIIDDPASKLATAFSPRDDQLIKPKSKSKIEQPKPAPKYTSSTKKLSLESARKPVNLKPETTFKPSSPTDFALNRSSIITNIEAKRGKLSQTTYNSQTKETSSHNRQSKNFAENKSRKLNETLSQPIKPFKVELGREGKKSQPFIKNPTSRDSYSEKKSHKSSGPNLPSKVMLENYHNSEKKLNVKVFKFFSFLIIIIGHYKPTTTCDELKTDRRF